MFDYKELNRPRELFLDAEGALWKSDLRSPLVDLFEHATTNKNIQQNAHSLLRIGVEGGWAECAVRQDTLNKLLSQVRVAVAVWNAAIATPIQYRLLQATRQSRAHLVRLGISNDLLAFPDWLKRGEERDDQATGKEEEQNEA